MIHKSMTKVLKAFTTAELFVRFRDALWVSRSLRDALLVERGYSCVYDFYRLRMRIEDNIEYASEEHEPFGSVSDDGLKGYYQTSGGVIAEWSTEFTWGGQYIMTLSIGFAWSDMESTSSLAWDLHRAGFTADWFDREVAADAEVKREKVEVYDRLRRWGWHQETLDELAELLQEVRTRNARAIAREAAEAEADLDNYDLLLSSSDDLPTLRERALKLTFNEEEEYMTYEEKQETDENSHGILVLRTRAGGAPEGAELIRDLFIDEETAPSYRTVRYGNMQGAWRALLIGVEQLSHEGKGKMYLHRPSGRRFMFRTWLGAAEHADPDTHKIEVL